MKSLARIAALTVLRPAENPSRGTASIHSNDPCGNAVEILDAATLKESP